MPDDPADRLLRLLDLALQSARAGDDAAAWLAVQEAEKAARSLPRKSDPPDVICLPGPTG